ncbi:hypothetical protein THAOC_29692, partial [Thalassiosira oceanica]
RPPKKDKDSKHEEERLGDDDKEEEEDDDSSTMMTKTRMRMRKRKEGNDEDDREGDNEGALARPRDLRKSTRSSHAIKTIRLILATSLPICFVTSLLLRCSFFIVRDLRVSCATRALLPPER